MQQEAVNETSSPALPADRREWCYVQSPATYGIAGCSCGNENPEWSEFQGHLWCSCCNKDFIPEHNGIFDGPIAINVAQMVGISLDRYVIATGKTVKFEEYFAAEDAIRNSKDNADQRPDDVDHLTFPR